MLLTSEQIGKYLYEGLDCKRMTIYSVNYDKDTTIISGVSKDNGKLMVVTIPRIELFHTRFNISDIIDDMQVIGILFKEGIKPRFIVNKNGVICNKSNGYMLTREERWVYDELTKVVCHV